MRCKGIEICTSGISFLFFFSFSTTSVHAFFTRVLFIKIHQDPLIFISSRTRNTTSYLVNLHYLRSYSMFAGTKYFAATLTAETPVAPRKYTRTDVKFRV